MKRKCLLGQTDLLALRTFEECPTSSRTPRRPMQEDQQPFERILFLVEYAHWFYEDNSVEKDQSLKSLTKIAWQRIDELQPANDDIISRFSWSHWPQALHGCSIPRIPEVMDFSSSSSSGIQTRKTSERLCFIVIFFLTEGFSIWKAKTSSSGNSFTIVESQQTSKPVVEVVQAPDRPWQELQKLQIRYGSDIAGN